MVRMYFSNSRQVQRAMWVCFVSEKNIVKGGYSTPDISQHPHRVG